MAASNIRQSQEALEIVQETPASAGIRETQAALEVAREAPPSALIHSTQAALETVSFPPNDVWASQVCLEVLFPGYTPPTPASRRNHSFIGVWMGTGHADNASFSY